MEQFNAEEFWKALGRLYDSTLELRKIAEEQSTSLQALLEEIRNRKTNPDS